MKKLVLYGIQLLFVSIFLASFQGCAQKKAVAPATESNTKNLSNEKSEGNIAKNPKLSKLVGKNFVKGIIRDLNRDNAAQMWNYEIDGIDTKNGKLSYVNFNHKTALANEGDLVYASFDGNKLTDLFVIKAGYKSAKQQSTPYVPKKTNHVASEKSAGKRDKAHQVLAVPQEEAIKLN